MEIPISKLPAQRSSASENQLNEAVVGRIKAVRAQAGYAIERIKRHISEHGSELDPTQDAELTRHLAILAGIQDPNSDNLVLSDEKRATDLLDKDDLLAVRLLVAEERLFQVYDRWRAESEVRLGVVPPLVGLSIVLAARMHLVWLLLTFRHSSSSFRAFESVGAPGTCSSRP